MAANVSQSEEACTCPVCCDIFQDPVVLLCGHSFCEPCLQEWWRQSVVQRCPVCMEILTMARPTRNLALRDLSDIVRQEASQRATSGAPDLCELHNEKLKLFCRDDQQLICLVCRDAQKHEKHNFAPINEAAEEHRINIRTQLMHLNSKLGSLKAHQFNCNKMASHIKARQTETTIKEEFQKLYEFLRTKEAARIDALRKEAALKSDTLNNRIVNVNEEIALLTDRIETINQELTAEDLAFMLNVKSTLERSQCNVQEPETPPGGLIDEVQHVRNLLFNVWDQMKKIIKYTPVTLDPNTSGTQLILSENLTHSSESKTTQQLPDNPERKGPCIVLGFEGFSGGRQCWNVEVNGFWAVGVAAKTKHATLAPIFGIYTYGPEGPLFELITDKRIYSFSTDVLPKNIKVQLDFDQGTLSFFDLDRKTLIYVIKNSFKGTVFPYFRGAVKILPGKVRTTLWMDAFFTRSYSDAKYTPIFVSIRK
ncbi:zinc-binding protein A33 isoform X2 [Hippoglossus stenolepis]|uniref:zinc-binding protein A33 isoform X2 n=1 Tax=Hippoglossus stenolepis TaxID=195615 RepID=UPI00159BF391|nr:zinc-binding protein A33 isoform X2 [Hippoglossus stenolepis]